MVLVLARGDGEEANGAQGGRVAEVRLGGDDGVRDVVVDSLQRGALVSAHVMPAAGLVIPSERRGRVT